MNIELKKISFNARLSEETNAFAADVYVNGKKAGTASNNGTGGQTNVLINDPVLRIQLETYYESLPPVTEDGYSFQPTLDFIVDDLLVKYLIEKETLKQSRKMCKRETLFRLKGDQTDTYRTVTSPFSPQVKQWIVTKYGEQLEEILNEKIAK